MPPRKPPARKYTFKVINVKGDGNCFFRVIYKSAKHSNNLLKLVNCFLDKPFDIYVNSEKTFILDIREKLAKIIEEGNDGGQIAGMFEYLSAFTNTSNSNDENNIENYKEILESLPAWIKKTFPKPPKSLEEFRNEICKNIRKQGTYVSQIEIDIFHYYNNTFCNESDKHVVLSIFATQPKNNEDVDLSHINILNVANIHYKYIRSYESIDNEPKSKSSSIFSSTESTTSPSSSSSPPPEPPKRVTRTQTKKTEPKIKESRKTEPKIKESKITEPKKTTSKKQIDKELKSDSSMSSETREIMKGFNQFILENKDKM